MERRGENPAKTIDWYSLFNGSLTSFLRRSIREPADRDDIAQEIFLRLLRVTSPEQIRSPKAYLFKVTAHVLAEWRAKERQLKHHDQDALADLTADATNSIAMEDMAHFVGVLRALPHAYAAAIVLRWHHGMHYAEIATALGVSERMVKRYIAKGYAAIRVMSEQNEGRSHE